MELADIYQAYQDIASEVDKEFGRVSNIFTERMQRRRGCSGCCSQLFSISASEAAWVSRAVKELEPEQLKLMVEKARAYLEELTGVEVEQTLSIEDHSIVVKEALDRLIGRHHIPCPALENDACSIYDHRPIIARKFGIPLWDSKRPNILQACELNFKQGEIIEMDGLIEPQIELAYRWLEFKTSVHKELTLPDLVATVASAIVFDYDQLLQ